MEKWYPLIMLNMFLSLLISTAWAEPSGRAYTYWCSLSADVKGMPHHYLLYGRDAWEGETIMRCSSSIDEISQRVTVSYFSKNPGFGADTNSFLTFTITLWTAKMPQALEINTTVPALIDGSMVHWQISAPDNELTGSVWAGSAPGVAQSLSLGTLSIKPNLRR